MPSWIVFLSIVMSSFFTDTPFPLSCSAKSFTNTGYLAFIDSAEMEIFFFTRKPRKGENKAGR